MIRVLVAIKDPVLTDVIVTAFKQFPGFATYRVPPHQVCEVIQDSEYDAVVVHMDKGDETKSGICEHIRMTSTSIEIIGLVDQSIKDRFNRFKLEYGLFSLASLPLDPFSFAKSIARLDASLRNSNRSRTA